MKCWNMQSLEMTNTFYIIPAYIEEKFKNIILNTICFFVLRNKKYSVLCFNTSGSQGHLQFFRRVKWA